MIHTLGNEITVLWCCCAGMWEVMGLEVVGVVLEAGGWAVACQIFEAGVMVMGGEW